TDVHGSATIQSRYSNFHLYVLVETALATEIQVARRHLEPDFLIRHPSVAAARRAAVREQRALRTAQRGDRALDAKRDFDLPDAKQVGVPPVHVRVVGAERAVLQPLLLQLD